MAYENIPVVSALPNIVTLYNLAPWLWDAIIICAILGLFFREGFKRIKISDDESKARKIGGVFGFAVGLIVVIGMYMRGWQLINLFPWILIALVGFGAVMLRQWLIDRFGEDYSTHATIGTLLAAFLVIGFLLSSIPGIEAIMGGWAGLILLFAFWAGILGAFVWAMWSLTGAVGERAAGWGRGDREPRAPREPRERGPGIWDRIFRRKEKPEKPERAAPEVETSAGRTGDEADKADRDADEASTVISAAKRYADELRRLIDACRKDTASIEVGVDAAKDAGLRKYADVLKAYSTRIKKAYAEFKDKKVLNEFEKVKHSYEKVGIQLRDLIEKVKSYRESLINGLGPKIARINIPKLKAELTEEYRKYVDELSRKHAEVVAAFKKFSDDFREATRHANIPSIGALVAEIDKAESDLRTLLDQTSALIKGRIKLSDASEISTAITQIKRNCVDIIKKCELMLEKLNTFLESDPALLQAAIDAMKKSNSQNVKALVTRVIKQIEELKPKVSALEAKVDEQLRKQGEAKKKKEEEVADINKILTTINLQTQKLDTLLTHAITFIKTLYGVFRLDLDPGTVAKLKGDLEVAAGEVAAKFKIEEAEKIEPTLSDNIDKAKEDIEQRIAICKAYCKTEAKELAEAKTIVKNIISEIVTAAEHLEAQLKAGVDIKDKDKLQTLLAKLKEFLQEEQKIEQILEIISTYDQYIVKTFEEKIKAYVAGDKRISLEVKSRTDALAKEISNLRLLIRKLREGAPVLRELEREPVKPV